ncbi:16853_t:CDS:2 [Cetraspora pellucida]|uniref:16853_t:CDS:1 n=1 Tax=Cetraspora pellucida TaxID=1433469 RepID=A0A9N8YWU3_9GLOM|nr:16853_t:CDS:2 [Cetraspora pellucida]
METTDIFDIEQNDLYDIMPSFTELEMEEYDEADDMICQHVQEFESPKNKKTSQESYSHRIVKNIYGNIECIFIRFDHTIVDEEIKQEINNFIYNYINIHGFPSSGQHM